MEELLHQHIARNLILFLFTTIWVVILHEIGHFLILRAAGSRPKIFFSLFRARTSAFIDKRRNIPLIKALSATNAIFFGFFPIVVFFLYISQQANPNDFAIAAILIVGYYLIGVYRDSKNIRRYVEK